MRRHLRQSWFLLVLCLFLVMGLTLGNRLSPWAEGVSKELVIALVMLAISLATDFRRLLSGRSNWHAVLLALGLNTIVAPPVGWLFSHALPIELSRGLVLAMTLPCTVASAIVWTRRGGGNDVAAAVVSLVTNFACFVTLPMWTSLLIGQTAQAQPGHLAVKLLACVAAPMLLGQLVRLNAAAARWSDDAKADLGLFSQWGVLLLALVGAIAAGKAMHSGEPTPSALDWLVLLFVVVFLHVSLLGIAWALGLAAKLPRAERLTLLIAGSQKTMAVGLGVALDFGPLALFPLVAYHFTQLVIDTLLVDRWRSNQ